MISRSRLDGDEHMEIGILPPELKSVEQLFAGDIRFSVPRYQRSFAWTTDETQELWEDVTGAMPREGEYFLGTIVLHSKPSADPQEIIDGQQRLACITMLFSAIRNVFLASHDDRAIQIETAFLGSKGYSRDAISTPKVQLNRINDATFRQHVLNSKDLTTVEKDLKDKSLHPSNRLLLEAYKFFLDKVTSAVAARGTQADEFLVPLIDTLRNKLKIITIPVNSDEAANLFFESLNARGKELAISDLVKNRLYLEAKEPALVDHAEQLWAQMESDLVRRPIPEFIRHYWIAKKAAENSPMVREKHLYRMITKAITGQRAALELIEDLRKCATDYVRISDYTLWSDDPVYDDSFKESLEDLRLFRVTQTNPLLLNAIQEFSSPKEIANTFRFVANFAFRYFIIGNQSPGNMERLSADIAYGIRAKTYVSASDIANALRAANPDPIFRADFALAVLPKARKRIARYTLAKINNYLVKQAGGAEQVVNPDAKTVNLEHVLPQGCNAVWRSAFPPKVDPEEYVYRIGNMTLLNTKINRDVADRSFTDKKSIALDGSSLKVNEVFKDKLSWADREIEQRQDSLAKTALATWKL